MNRRARSLAVAAAIGLIALSLMSGVASADDGGSKGAPKSLTHRFPLGSHTLSHTKTAPAARSATTPRAGPATTPRVGPATTPSGGAATTPRAAPTTTPHRHATAPTTGKHSHGGIPSLALLVLIPVLIVLAVVGSVVRFLRSPNGARWADLDQDEVEREPPSLPVRRRDREPPPLPIRGPGHSQRGD